MTRNVGAASTLIRGGQTTQHWWRMGTQVLKFSLVVAAVFYVASFILILNYNLSTVEMRIAIYYELAERGVLDGNGFNKPYTFETVSGAMVTLEATDLYRDAGYRSIRDNFFNTIYFASRFSMIPAGLTGLFAMFVFMRAGNKIQDNEFIRGAQKVSARQLKQWSKSRWTAYNKKHRGRKKAKPLTISGVPFPPNAVEAQTCIYGTVGVGKTNAMSEMLQTIRKNGGKAIIYDKMGGFVGKFYDEETDFILNPFDNRSVSWNPFDDALDQASFTQMAEVMIPERKGAASDPFWSQSARIVFDYAARELYKTGPRTVEALISYVINMDADKLSALIEQTPGRHFFNDSIEKTSQSIRANLIAELRFLEFLRADARSLSIREWMNSDEPSFLFLTGDAEHSAATRNIISTVLEISANALMSRGPASEPRCYFFMDELPSLNRLPFLVQSLAEIRQFGGAFVLGYQVYSQLEDIYGREAAQSISGTTNNRIVFNTPDFRTAKNCSESLGNVDTWESNSNISVGAHEARDGVAFTQQRVERPIVSAAEIQNLPQFTAFVKFAYDSPTAEVLMELVEIEEQAERYQPYLGDAFGLWDGFESDDSEDDKAGDETSQSGSVGAFHEWCRWKLGADPSQIDGLTTPHPEYSAYWDHFQRAIAAGTPPENIQPICLVTEGLMTNSAPQPPQPSPSVDKAQTDPARHPPAPVDAPKETMPCSRPRLGTGLTPIASKQPQPSGEQLPLLLEAPEAASSPSEPKDDSWAPAPSWGF